MLVERLVQAREGSEPVAVTLGHERAVFRWPFDPQEAALRGSADPAPAAPRGYRAGAMIACADRRTVVRWVARAALVPAGALAVHQLRYLLAFGGRAGVEFARQGHSYLHSLVPWIGATTAANEALSVAIGSVGSGLRVRSHEIDRGAALGRVSRLGQTKATASIDLDVSLGPCQRNALIPSARANASPAATSARPSPRPCAAGSTAIESKSHAGWAG